MDDDGAMVMKIDGNFGDRKVLEIIDRNENEKGK